MVAAAATAPVAGGFSSSSASSNRVSAIPVATPVAVTREAARRLVRAGIPLPDKYREVLGPAPERRPPARPATEEERVAALPDAPEASPSTAFPNGVPRAPSSTSTPPSRVHSTLHAGGYARTLDPTPPSATRRRSPASRAPDDREKMRKVAERELKLEGSYAAVAEEAAARRTREVRRLATLEAEARRAKAEESAVAARRAAQEARERQHHTVFAPPQSSSAGRRRGRREREFEPTPRRNYFDASSEREGGGWDEARWEEDDGFAPAPPPSVTPRARGAKARVRFAETPEGRAARELLGGGGGGRAPLGERFVNRMRARSRRRADVVVHGGGEAPRVAQTTRRAQPRDGDGRRVPVRARSRRRRSIGGRSDGSSLVRIATKPRGGVASRVARAPRRCTRRGVAERRLERRRRRRIFAAPGPPPPADVPDGRAACVASIGIPRTGTEDDATVATAESRGGSRARRVGRAAAETDAAVDEARRGSAGVEREETQGDGRARRVQDERRRIGGARIRTREETRSRQRRTHRDQHGFQRKRPRGRLLRLPVRRRRTTRATPRTSTRRARA